MIVTLAFYDFWNGYSKMEDFFCLFYRGKKKKNVYDNQTEETICKADCIGNTESWEIMSNYLSCSSTGLKFHKEHVQPCKA